MAPCRCLCPGPVPGYHVRPESRMPRSTYFCIDIECGGPVPALYDMMSLGAVVVHEVDETHVIGARFYVEIEPSAPRVDPGAMAIHGLTLEHLRAHGQPLGQALDQLSAFVAEHTEAGSTPTFVGHNAPFDWMMVRYYYEHTRVPHPFGYNALDTKALFMGLFGVPWGRANKEEIAARTRRGKGPSRGCSLDGRRR